MVLLGREGQLVVEECNHKILTKRDRRGGCKGVLKMNSGETLLERRRQYCRILWMSLLD